MGVKGPRGVEIGRMCRETGRGVGGIRERRMEVNEPQKEHVYKALCTL